MYIVWWIVTNVLEKLVTFIFKEGTWMLRVLPKCWYVGRNLHGILSQKIDIASMGTSVITHFLHYLFN
jgi:hypothetical protein